MLFNIDEEESVQCSVFSVQSDAENANAAWIRALLRSAVFAEQKQLGGRARLNDEVMTNLLTVIDDRGGKMTTTALARAIGTPLIRLPGLLAKAQRLLNVDGYEVLSRDQASDTVQLDRALLLKQFDLVE
jgi:ABC-type sulfate transport system substrate-binding protein